MQTVCNLVEQAYLIAFEYQEIELMLHLGLAIQLSISKAVSEMIEEAEEEDAVIDSEDDDLNTGPVLHS
ncbi:hypothetical protein [Rhizobium sp. AAP43]|uniref:hypothetical protein n=1 Tax=Rhizobium sp. AAP43 TaxID=1523420 RepID=UPI0006B8D5E7|nr:hypothetical protein [Rhizobium sp. AAP43]KPF41506.1 hypothetical protein IP76_21215 [Rhizobium sp. AAP43]